ncbi:MAG: archease [Betaproteobacteria bacterium RBG_16_58_11]|nr:MAG: archease [Betaproteobacteria bacterium RBG_16_58_11]OFZ98626.1 MAG: archease [Betaproteobacteria bacterium RBG_19FT_COMBO_58_11]
MTHWEHFTHGADIGVRGIGNTLSEAFEQAALAMTAVICDPALVQATESVTVTCDAPDAEYLLADWLNRLVFEMATRHLLFSHFQVTIQGEQLTATAWGEPVEVARHQPAVEVKGATYTELKVAQTETGEWLAQCIVDV